MANDSSSPTRLIENLRAGRPQKLAVYGTSLSNGMALILRDALKAHFGDLITVVNAAIPGAASRTGLKFLEERVLAHRPDCLLMEWAVNDAHTYYHSPDSLDKGIDEEESVANVTRMIEMVRAALPDCEIVLQTTNPAWDPPEAENRPGSNRPDLESYYEGYREVARSRGLKLIDGWTAWSQVAEEDPDRFRTLIPDGVHPTPAAIRSVLVPYLVTELGA